MNTHIYSNLPLLFVQNIKVQFCVIKTVSGQRRRRQPIYGRRVQRLRLPLRLHADRRREQRDRNPGPARRRCRLCRHGDSGARQRIPDLQPAREIPVSRFGHGSVQRLQG